MYTYMRTQIHAYTHVRTRYYKINIGSTLEHSLPLMKPLKISQSAIDRKASIAHLLQ